MRRAASWVLPALLLLAGCLDDGSVMPSPSTSSGPVLPPAAFYGEARCRNALLFQFVDYAETDPYLPPGFHPRDSQGFLGTAAAFGQGALLFMVLNCESGTAGPLNVSFLGIFVEAPSVPGLAPAPFNFYELARYGQAGEFGGALASSGWPWSLANATVNNIGQASLTLDVDANVTDAEGDLASIGGVLTTPIFVGTGPTRYWYQDEAGLAYIEYGAFLDAQVGPGRCSARQGTPLALFVGPAVGGVAGIDGQNCTALNGGDPLVAVLLDLRLNATYQELPGVSPT